MCQSVTSGFFFGENVEILLEMRLSKIGTAFHPSIPLALKADEYLDALDDWKYMESSKSCLSQ